MSKSSVNQEINTFSYCALHEGKVIVDGEVIFQSSSADFLKEAYTELGISYPKFFKMDDLSKLCFLTTELLLRKNSLSDFSSEEKSIVIHNRNSSIISDVKFRESCKDIPSPAHFVYTLPNVMIGEVCIRNQIKGENHCFVAETYEHEFQFDWIKNILLRGSKVCIHGWVDFGLKGYSSLLFLTEKETPETESITQKINVKKIIEQYAGTY